MSRQSASAWLRGYMEIEHICLTQVSKDLGIPVERLSTKCVENFLADEFLTICAYLDLDLERFLQGNY